MSGRIPQTFIDELINRVDIVDVIDSRVQLKKSGSNYMACCPFHTEKTPSFTVSPDKQFYHCFGCGAHGTAIGFLMEYEHMDFIEAVEELAGMAGMEIPREVEKTHAKPEENLYEVMEKAAAFYKRQLRAHPQSDRAIAYLKKRGMSGEIAAEFGVGYAPPGWDNLIQDMGKTERELKQLMLAGLITEKGRNGPYDRFRDRIMIPITDRRGRVIAFGGRILGSENGAESGPKYLNSPETPIFHKGRELYGLHEVRKTLRHPKQLLVVEGYMDVLALAQFDIRYAVATLGTATTREHLDTLYRIVPRVVFCFDGDRAGREAAWRALENALPVMREGHEAAFLFLPEGEDPDSLVHKEGREAFEQRLDSAVPLSRFLLDQLASQTHLDSEDGRARMVELSRPLLNRIPDPVFRHMMFDSLARRVGMRTEKLEQLVDVAPETGHASVTGRRPAIRSTRAGRRPPIRLAITLLLQHPALAQELENIDFLRDLDLPGAGLLHELLETLQKNPNLTPAALLERWRDRPEAKHLNILIQSQLPGDEQALRKEFLDTILFLETGLKQQRWQLLQEKLSREGLDNEELNEWNQLLKDRSVQNDAKH